MLNHTLTEDTKAIIMLCGVLGKAARSDKPLSLKEYSALARCLVGENMRPGDLLQKENAAAVATDCGIDKKRLQSLLGRGVQLGLAVEKWHSNGIWVVSRSDACYPARYKKHLKDKAPPLLFGAGNRDLLSGGGLGMVGSRDMDQAGEDFAREVAELCAHNQMPVTSGGARGIDHISMTAALAAGGVATGVLVNDLLRKSVGKDFRNAIAAGRLLLLSPYHPEAGFRVGNAMSRNKLIYAMSDYTVVVSAEYDKGGTWAGATEELRRKDSLPVFVRTGNDVPPGNSKLLELGAITWSNPVSLKQHLDDAVKSCGETQGSGSYMAAREISTAVHSPPVSEYGSSESVVTAIARHEDTPASIYEAVLPVLLQRLHKAGKPAELAKDMGVCKSQFDEWLKKAVDENKIEKLKNPARYQICKQLELKQIEPTITAASGYEDTPASVYEAVLPVLLQQLEEAMAAKELAKNLDVSKRQLDAWLQKAVTEKKIRLLKKPVRYQKWSQSKQL